MALLDDEEKKSILEQLSEHLDDATHIEVTASIDGGETYSVKITMQREE
jgi:hypothetical protein